MNISDFDIYKDLLKGSSGLVVTHDKSYLLDSRLNPIAKKWGYSDIEAMFSPDGKRLYFASNRPLKEGDEPKDFDIATAIGCSWFGVAS